MYNILVNITEFVAVA